MKLIIDIPEKVVTAIQNGQDYRYDIHTAIAQGIPYEERPQDDLISRKTLKKDIEENSIVLNGVKIIEVDSAKALIDIAPTVALPIMPNDKYDEVIIAHERIAYERGVADGYAEAIEEGKWIPVTERLPEYSGLYLVNIDSLVTVANFGGKSFMGKNASNPIEVDAWQPLPEPYKGGNV